MAIRRRGGLDDEQVAKLRQDVTEGRRPRVAVSGGQFPDGTTGTVVRVGAADADGAEFITVRVKAGSVTDELGFAPAELALPQRAKTARTAPRRARTADREVTTAPQVAPAAASPASAVPAASRPASPPSSAPASPPAPSAPRPEAGPPAPTTTVSIKAEKAEKARPRPASASRRSSPAPAVSITIASAGVTWTVSATRGARSVVKKAPLAPGIVTALTALLELPEIDEAVTAVNGAALDEAEARAAQLRAELAEIEAVLVSHRPPPQG